MPLEIRELNIQVNVGQQAEGGQQQGEAQQSSGSGGGGNADTIKQCVEEVMDIINKLKER